MSDLSKNKWGGGRVKIQTWSVHLELCASLTELTTGGCKSEFSSPQSALFAFQAELTTHDRGGLQIGIFQPTLPNQRFLVIAWIKINGLADKLIINRIGDFTEDDTGGGGGWMGYVL